MTEKEAAIVERYYDTGHIVIIGGTGYVDSEILGIYFDEEEDCMVYDSEVFSARPMREVQWYDVTIAKPIRSIESDFRSNDGYDADDDKYVQFVDGKEV